MSCDRPLKHLKVLITRGKEGAKDLSSLIEGYGGIPVVIPLLGFKTTNDSDEPLYIKSIHNYEWVIFTSKNGVAFFLEKLKNHSINPASLPAKFAAVGTKTRSYCEKFGLSVSYVPEEFTGDELATRFITDMKPSGNVLVPKGNLARNVIATGLTDAGIECDEWIVYETFLPAESEEKLKRMIDEEGVDILTFTSSSTVHHFMKVIEQHSLQEKVEYLPAACIGPLTKKTAEQYGLHVKMCPNTYTVDEMVSSIIQYASMKKDES
ncbi:uroporphyrinogen-III synthase [Rossellomorea aquimaris]|uniref:uroporphyrinogen-III synthase n=1 Tax=Rossellomorea aquimaris TaxID=189382 RepID=UPI001CD35CD8|nr:uroporphyrinogen-III synthase [Rossellomorea aquimaris]MCA1056338.1 uroporphyrinogen-III synthase [Rossellomorea aquimaris]